MLNDSIRKSTSMELNHIFASLTNTHYNFEKCIENLPKYVITNFETTNTKQINSLIDILINNMIISLYKFSEISNNLHFIENRTSKF